MEQISLVPSTSRVVRVKVWPATRFSTPFLKSFRRISGPLVSSSAATGLPSSSRRAFSFSRRPRCSSWEPWEKLKRATFMPLAIRSRSTPSLSVEGPRVQIIFVFLMQYTSVNSLLPISGTASLQAAVYDQWEQKLSVQRVGLYGRAEKPKTLPPIIIIIPAQESKRNFCLNTSFCIC